MSTIAAISTAPGNAGIGIIRLSGEKCFEILEKIFEPKNKGPIKGYTIKYGNIVSREKNSMPTESIRMAIAVLVVIPIACVYPFFQRYFISGLTVGAVKG